MYGRRYEAAIEVTPPGQLVPYLNIILPPQREAPIEVKSDDPYDLDVSDESDEDDEVAKPEVESTAHLHFDGHIPDFWGARHIEGPNRAERDNSFRLMLSSHIYYSERSNSIFTRQSALDASLYERDYDRAYRPTLNNQVYARAPRGIPQDPFEVNRLLTLLGSRARFTSHEQIEAFLLLTELYNISLLHDCRPWEPISECTPSCDGRPCQHGCPTFHRGYPCCDGESC